MAEDWLEELSRLDQENGQYDVSAPNSSDIGKCVNVSIKAIETTDRLPDDYIPNCVDGEKRGFCELVDVQSVPQSTLDKFDRLVEEWYKVEGAS